MKEHNDNFPWVSHYGHYNYFEDQMKNHDKVASLKQIDNGIYEIKRAYNDTLSIFICECYAFGVAEIMEVLEKLGKINAVIINSAWCGYTPDAKRYCRDRNIGLFKIGEFMGAINRHDYWTYLTKQENEYFKTQGWI